MNAFFNQIDGSDPERQSLDKRLKFLRQVAIQKGNKIQSLRSVIQRKNNQLNDEELKERIQFLEDQIAYQEFLEQKLVEIIQKKESI